MFRFFIMLLVVVFMPVNVRAQTADFKPVPEIRMRSGTLISLSEDGHYSDVIVKWSGLPEFTAQTMQSEGGTVMLSGLVYDNFSVGSVMWNGTDTMQNVRVRGISYSDKTGISITVDKMSVREIGEGITFRDIKTEDVRIIIDSEGAPVSVTAQKADADYFSAASDFTAGGMHNIKLQGMTISRTGISGLSVRELAAEFIGDAGTLSRTLNINLHEAGRTGGAHADALLRVNTSGNELTAELTSPFLSLAALLKLDGVSFPLNSASSVWAAALDGIKPLYARLALKDAAGVLPADHSNLMLTVPAFLSAAGVPGVIRSAVIKWLEQPSNALTVEGVPEGDAMRWSASSE